MGVDKKILCIREAEDRHREAHRLWVQFQETREKWVQAGRRTEAAAEQVELYTEMQEQTGEVRCCSD